MLKFNKLDRVRETAESKIDEHFAARMNAILGPMALLHQRKRMLAASGAIEDDGVIAKATEQDTVLLTLDAERRSIKFRIRECKSSDDIQKILAGALA